MKKIILISQLFFITLGFSQTTPPELVGTWELKSIGYGFDTSYYEILDTAPATNPTTSFLVINPLPYVTINDNLTVTGKGVCNTFSGTLKVKDVPSNNSFNKELIFTIISTSLDCGSSVLNEVENNFFYYLRTKGEPSPYAVSPTNLFSSRPGESSLQLVKKGALNTLNYKLHNLKISPNPSNSNIYIKHQNIDISKIEIFNTTGQKVKTIQNNFGSIDISNLVLGTYLLKIYTQKGTATKKFIKK